MRNTAHSAYDMFYKYKYLIVNLVFPTSFFFFFFFFFFWRRNFFLIAPFPDHCIPVPFSFFNCTPGFYNGPILKLFISVGLDRSFVSVAGPNGIQHESVFICPTEIFSDVVWHLGISSAGSLLYL